MYVVEHGYTDVTALVAFSGEVTDLDSAIEKATETSMNPGLKGRNLRDAFATDEYQVMLVANKFQTGFDQPRLAALLRFCCRNNQPKTWSICWKTWGLDASCDLPAAPSPT
jgi:hypothetical protein